MATELGARITVEQVRALRAEARANDHAPTVEACDAALAGDAGAIARCVEIIEGLSWPWERAG